MLITKVHILFHTHTCSFQDSRGKPVPELGLSAQQQMI